MQKFLKPALKKSGRFFKKRLRIASPILKFFTVLLEVRNDNWKKFQKLPIPKRFPWVDSKDTYLTKPLVFGDSKYLTKLYRWSNTGKRFSTRRDLSLATFEIVRAKAGKIFDFTGGSTIEKIPIWVSPGEDVECSWKTPAGDGHSFRLTGSQFFQWLPVGKGVDVTLEGKSSFVCGFPSIQSNDQKPNNKKVILLFIDGLADRESLGHGDWGKLMPYTAELFSEGIEFRRHYANAEWTFPSLASVMTGVYSQSHGLFHPRKDCHLRSHTKTLAEYFHEAKYSTFYVGGNWRFHPAYGHCRGFDRLLYRESMPAHEVIEHTISHFRGLSAHNLFSVITFFDLHHDLGALRLFRDHSLSKVDADDIGARRKKSVFLDKNPELIDLYTRKIKELDVRLSTLYCFFLNEFSRDDLSVILFSDHGQAFLTESEDPLSDARTHVPLFVKSTEVGEKTVVRDPTENVDIYPMALREGGLFDREDCNGDCKLPACYSTGSQRSFSFSQSIFPGQTYKAKSRYRGATFSYESRELVTDDGRGWVAGFEPAAVTVEWGEDSAEKRSEFASKIRKLGEVADRSSESEPK